MEKRFAVKGVNPMGRIIELEPIAPTADEAKKMAEDTGLLYVVERKLPRVQRRRSIQTESLPAALAI